MCPNNPSHDPWRGEMCKIHWEFTELRDLPETVLSLFRQGCRFLAAAKMQL